MLVEKEMLLFTSQELLPCFVNLWAGIASELALIWISIHITGHNLVMSNFLRRRFWIGVRYCRIC